MRVSTIEVLERSDGVELCANIDSDSRYEDDDWFPSFRLWYRFPAWCTPYISADNGDPFLAALLLPAMRIGETLSIEAPVSATLVGSLPDIMSIYAAFDPRAQAVGVDAVTRAEDPCAASERRVGLYFSMGVDSFYSLLKNQRDHPADEKTITDLVSVHGFDVAHGGWSPTFPSQLLSSFTQVATQTGKSLLPVVTNVRQVGARLAPWTMLHGAAMASVALALGSAFKTMMIAASSTYDLLVPWGTHPVLDPLWSTDRLTFVHDGCELDTIDKTRFVAREPLVLKYLRVCPGFGDGYNCGRCMKCLRTMIDLLQAGKLAQCQTLPHEIDPEALRVALRMPTGPVHIRNFRRRQEAFARSGQRPDLNAVLSEHLRDAAAMSHN